MASWIDRLIFQPPEQEKVYLVREAVKGAVCDACGGSDVRRYPIANEHGARIVTKCQACMHVLALERPGPQDVWPPFRAVAYDWPASPAERASRDRLGEGRSPDPPRL